MATRPNAAGGLIGKIRRLSPDKIAQVEEFLDSLDSTPAPARPNTEGRLRSAAAEGFVVPPEPGRRRSSVTEQAPIVVPGIAPSEIVLQQRR